MSKPGNKMVIVSGGGLNFEVAIKNALAKGWKVVESELSFKLDWDEDKPFPVDQILSEKFVHFEFPKPQ